MVEFPREYIVKVSESLTQGEIIVPLLAYIGIGACHWLVWNEKTQMFQVGAEILGIDEKVCKRSKLHEMFLVIPWRKLIFTVKPNAQLMTDEELTLDMSSLQNRRKASPTMKSYDSEYAICYGEWKRRESIKERKRKQPSEAVEVEEEAPGV